MDLKLVIIVKAITLTDKHTFKVTGSNQGLIRKGEHHGRKRLLQKCGYRAERLES